MYGEFVISPEKLMALNSNNSDLAQQLSSIAANIENIKNDLQGSSFKDVKTALNSIITEVKNHSMGVFYPEGHIGTDYNFLFDHKDIDKVFFRGFDDIERQNFIEHLDDYYQKNSIQKAEE